MEKEKEIKEGWAGNIEKTRPESIAFWVMVESTTCTF